MNSKLKAVVLLAASTLLVRIARPEEESILKDCTMIDRAIYWGLTFNKNAICDGGFKSMVQADTRDDQQEFVIALTQKKRFKTAFVQNNSHSQQDKKVMGESALYVGEDTGAFSADMTKCSADFFDSGFYDMACSTEGKNIAIRRKYVDPSFTWEFIINEVRLYQTPNLLQLADVTISAPAPKEPKWAATNLINNFSSRTPSGENLPPLLDRTGATAPWESCFKTGLAQLSADGNMLVITIDLIRTYFIHAILAVQDLFTGWRVVDWNDPLKFFQNYEIYIGSSATWAKNPKCPGGPQMKVDDTKSKVDGAYSDTMTSSTSYQILPTPSIAMWKFGNEVWCNMEGRYVSIVADLRHLAGQRSVLAPQGYEMSLCHLGVFGAFYKRIKPVLSSLEVTIGNPFRLDVEKIMADATTPISNTLDIMLRQKTGTELSWVSFAQYSLVTQVIIAPDSSVTPGNYTIVLESFDLAGGVFSALKTDTIAVSVVLPCPINSNQIDVLVEALAADPVRLAVQAGKVGSAQATYKGQQRTIVQLLALEGESLKLCGAISIELVSKHAFIRHQLESFTLYLSADETTKADVFWDSYLNVKVSSFSLKIPIIAEFTDCTVVRLAFEQQRVDFEYLVGSGSQRLALPRVVQQPNCGFEFSSLTIKKIDSGQLSTPLSVKLDPATKSLVVASDDRTFIGGSAAVTVAIEAAGVEQIRDVLAVIKFVDTLKPKPSLQNQKDNVSGGATSASAEVSQANGAVKAALATKDSMKDVILKVDKNLVVQLGIPNFVVPSISQEQADIVNTPAEELTTDQLFVPVPLAARLSVGEERVNEFRLMQREAIKSRIAVDAGAKKKIPPEVRFYSFSALGDLTFRFTTQIKFPEDITERIQSSLAKGRRDDLHKAVPPIEIFAVAGERTELDTVRPIMERWDLVSLKPGEVKFKIHFFNPLTVSSGHQPDFLIVQMMLSEHKDVHGNSLPPSLVKYVLIPRQFASEAEAQAVESSGQSAQQILAVNLSLNFLIALSADQLWSIINSVQVVLMIGLFDVQLPASVKKFNDFFVEITSAKAVSIVTEEAVKEIFYLPESDPKSVNFQNAGFDSPFFVKNAKEMLAIKVLFIFAPAFLSVALWNPARSSDKARQLRQQLHEKILWGPYIRLLMESYADTMLLAVLNLKELEWPSKDTTSVTANNVITLTVFVLFMLAPIALLCVAYKKFDLHASEDKQFNKKYGAFLEGTSRDKNKKWVALLVPVAFFLKRLALSLTLVLWYDFLWGQVAVQFAVTIVMIIFLMIFQPMETRFENHLEFFNEAFTLLILYFVMLFSPFVPDSEAQNWIGICYIVSLSLYAAVHVFLLLRGSERKLKLLLRMKKCSKHRMWCKAKPADDAVPGKNQATGQIDENLKLGSFQTVPKTGLVSIQEVSESRQEVSNLLALQHPVVTKKKKRKCKGKKKTQPGGFARNIRPSQESNLLLHDKVMVMQPSSSRLQVNTGLKLIREPNQEDIFISDADLSTPRGQKRALDDGSSVAVEDQIINAIDDYFVKYPQMQVDDDKKSVDLEINRVSGLGPHGPPLAANTFIAVKTRFVVKGKPSGPSQENIPLRKPVVERDSIEEALEILDSLAKDNEERLHWRREQKAHQSHYESQQKKE